MISKGFSQLLAFMGAVIHHNYYSWETSNFELVCFKGKAPVLAECHAWCSGSHNSRWAQNQSRRPGPI